MTYVTQNISRLIFIEKGCRRKIFNDENFAIYSIILNLLTSISSFTAQQVQKQASTQQVPEPEEVYYLTCSSCMNTKVS